MVQELSGSTPDKKEIKKEDVKIVWQPSKLSAAGLLLKPCL